MQIGFLTGVIWAMVFILFVTLRSEWSWHGWKGSRYFVLLELWFLVGTHMIVHGNFGDSFHRLDWYNTISPRGAGGIDITWPRCSSIFSESISCRELNSSKAKRQATQNHKHFTPTSKTHLICSIRPYRLVLMDDSFWCLTFWDKPLPSPLLSTVSLHLGRIETSEGFTSLSSQI